MAMLRQINQPSMEGTKACCKCGLVKPLTELFLTGSPGHSPHCKDCERLFCQERNYQQYAKKLNANSKHRKLQNMLNGARRRALEKQIPFDLDLDYLSSIAPSHCPYLNSPLRWELNTGSGAKPVAFPDSPSLDRIDSSQGYIKGNVVIVSHRANAIKRDATEQELIAMGRRIAQLKMQLAMPE